MNAYIYIYIYVYAYVYAVAALNKDNPTFSKGASCPSRGHRPIVDTPWYEGWQSDLQHGKPEQGVLQTLLVIVSVNP